MTRPDAGRKRNQIRRALKLEERDYGAIITGVHSDGGESDGERREVVQLGSAEAVREFWGLRETVGWWLLLLNAGLRKQKKLGEVWGGKDGEEGKAEE